MTCEIALPLLDEHQQDDRNSAATPACEAGVFGCPAAGGRRLDGKRILVIEDEPLVSMDIEASSGGGGCAVVGPAGSWKGKGADCGGEFDAALIDGNLGGEPVDELATALTQKESPFAFVCGYGRESLPLAFREAVLLGKPFSAEQLLATVTGLLGDRPGVVPLRQIKR